MTRNFDELRRRVRSTPERRARVAEFKAAMSDAVRLAELREARRASQEEVAVAMAVSQVRVSQIERSRDWYLSTLSGYVTALGGRLRVTAEFDDDSIEITAPDER
jgi:predicted methyltransferase